MCLVSSIIDSWNPDKKAQCASKNDEKAIWDELSNEDAFPKAPDDKFFVLVIDDLDRLIPEKAFEMIEHLRFYFDIDKTLIIMGINDIIINRYVLEKYFHRTYELSSIEKSFRFKNGEKFLDKIFHYTYEVHFSELNEIHLREINKVFKQNEELIKTIKSFPTSLELEPLPHRKWIKILNRIEAGLRNRIGAGLTTREIIKITKRLIVTSVLLELFPEFELAIRKYSNMLPEILKLRPEDIQRILSFTKDKILDNNERDRLLWSILKTFEGDTAYVEFPLNVLRKIPEFLKEEV